MGAGVDDFWNNGCGVVVWMSGGKWPLAFGFNSFGCGLIGDGVVCSGGCGGGGGPWWVKGMLGLALGLVISGCTRGGVGGRGLKWTNLLGGPWWTGR